MRHILMWRIFYFKRMLRFFLQTTHIFVNGS